MKKMFKSILIAGFLVSAVVYAAETSKISVSRTSNLEKRLSVVLKDAEIPEVIKAIAGAFDYSIIIDESVRGKLASLEIKDIYFEDALDQICEFAGLAYQINGNIIMVDSKKNVKESGRFKQ